MGLSFVSEVLPTRNLDRLSRLFGLVDMKTWDSDSRLEAHAIFIDDSEGANCFLPV